MIGSDHLPMAVVVHIDSVTHGLGAVVQDKNRTEDRFMTISEA